MRQKTSFPMQGCRNPLLLPLVVRKILTHCDRDALKRSRLVCKLWEEEANKIIHIKQQPFTITSRALTNFRFKKTNHIIVDNSAPPDSTIVLEVLQLLYDEDTRLKIQYLEVQNGSWQAPALFTLLRNLPHLRELTLSDNFTLPKLSPEQPPDAYLVYLPRLKAIHLNVTDDHLQNLVNLDFPFQLFKSAPNLREVTSFQNLISAVASDSNNNTVIFPAILFRAMTRHILSVRQLGQEGQRSSLPTLKKLHLNVDLRNEDLELLRNASIPLTSLHLHIDSTITTSVLNELLHSLNPTLKRLKLNYSTRSVRTPQLSSMNKLKCLCIQGQCGTEDSLRLKNKLKDYNGHYYRLCKHKCKKRGGCACVSSDPTRSIHSQSQSGYDNHQKGLFKKDNADLKRKADIVHALCTSHAYSSIDLDLEQMVRYLFNAELEPLFPHCPSTRTTEPSSTLKALELNGVFYLPKDILSLKMTFPNLTKLRISFLDDDLLRIVFSSFPNLVSFAATEGLYSDAGLTGISPEVQDLIQTMKPTSININELREFPSLLNLTSLTTLELDAAKVTNLGIIHGLALCYWVEEMDVNCPKMDDLGLLSIFETCNWESLNVRSGNFSKHLLNHLTLEARGRTFQCHSVQD